MGSFDGEHDCRRKVPEPHFHYPWQPTIYVKTVVPVPLGVNQRASSEPTQKPPTSHRNFSVDVNRGETIEPISPSFPNNFSFGHLNQHQMAVAPNGGENEMIGNCLENPPPHFSSRNEVLQSRTTPATVDSSSSSHHLTLERVQKMLQRQQLPTNVHHDLHSSSLATAQFIHLLRSQEERMRMALIETHAKQYRALLALAQEAVARDLMERDDRLRRAVHRADQLQDRVFQLRAELSAWRAEAAEHRRRASALQSELLAKENDEGRGDSDDVGSACVDPERRGAGGLEGVCRECEDRRAVVVLTPCMHLCLCDECNEEVAPVPCHICRSFRTGFFRIHLS